MPMSPTTNDVWVGGIERSVGVAGNGFRFDTYDSGGLFWAMDQAMAFWALPPDIREREIARIMEESLRRFNHETCARQYIELYEHMLHRPLVKDFAAGTKQ